MFHAVFLYSQKRNIESSNIFYILLNVQIFWLKKLRFYPVVSEGTHSKSSTKFSLCSLCVTCNFSRGLGYWIRLKYEN